MVVITLSAVPSTMQLVSGIPQNVTLVVNVAAIIFYTVDGTEPTTSSSVYTGPIVLSTQGSAVRLQAFATDGTSTSSTLDITYRTDVMNSRYPQSKFTFAEPFGVDAGLAGYSGTRHSPNGTFERINDNSYDLASLPYTYFDGYDADGYFPKTDYNEEIPIYSLKYSEENVYGQSVGMLPSSAKIIYMPPPPEADNAWNPVFNPKAQVLFVDSREPSDVLTILKPFYFDADVGQDYGSFLYSSYNSEGNFLTTGTFLKSHYNPKDNTLTFYYRDSLTNRWIISVEPVTRTGYLAEDSAGINGARKVGFSGGGVIFKWIPFHGTFSI